MHVHTIAKKSSRTAVRKISTKHFIFREAYVIINNVRTL